MLRPTDPAWWVALLAAAAVWVVGVAVYRVFFHPLAKIPGPRLAGLTHLYGTYFNATGGSRYFAQIEELHRRYGSVVRIGPNEVHLSNSANYEKIYYIGTRYNKSARFYGAFGSGTSAFSTVENKDHRVKRAALNPLFARKRVLELEDVVQAKAKKVLDRVLGAVATRTPVNLHDGFRAVSVDVITDYAFDRCYDLLDKDDFGADFMSMVRHLGPAVWFFQQWPLLQSVARGMPPWLASLLSKPLGSFTRMQADCRRQIVTIKTGMDAGYEKPPARTTIFHQLLNPKATEGHIVPSVDDMKDESFVMLSAAADTTGNAMTVAAYHVIRNEAMYRRLTAELKDAFPDPSARLDLTTLEKLPYLTAVIKEGLRMSFGVIGRLPRTTPEPGAVFDGYPIPAGTDVGMSSWMMHRDPIVFPNPDRFEPERWTDPAEAKRLEGNLVSFGKGSRQCLGMPLAYCELYVTLGTLFRHCDKLRVHECGPEDMTYEDYFAAYHPLDSRRFHVVTEA
ncbi:MAG: hypothetical protein M1832_005519 [Thelocarpon impressellum]|nr:MAG: hypothetical protein M1832_005519 [Thelocarpon impressellum]